MFCCFLSFGKQHSISLDVYDVQDIQHRFSDQNTTNESVIIDYVLDLDDSQNWFFEDDFEDDFDDSHNDNSQLVGNDKPQSKSNCFKSQLKSSAATLSSTYQQIKFFILFCSLKLHC
jgi:hypothetical protein